MVQEDQLVAIGIGNEGPGKDVIGEDSIGACWCQGAHGRSLGVGTST